VVLVGVPTANPVGVNGNASVVAPETAVERALLPAVFVAFIS
jgi:hypothetical protein